MRVGLVLWGAVVATLTVAAIMLPEPASAQSSGWVSVATATLDEAYDNYLGIKKRISTEYNLDASMQVSIYPQFGTPNGGKPVWLLAYSPSATWRPFTDTAIGRPQRRLRRPAILERRYHRLAGRQHGVDQPAE